MKIVFSHFEKAQKVVTSYFSVSCPHPLCSTVPQGRKTATLCQPELNKWLWVKQIQLPIIWLQLGFTYCEPSGEPQAVIRE